MRLPFNLLSLRQLRKYQKELENEYLILTDALRGITQEIEFREKSIADAKLSKKNKSNPV